MTISLILVLNLLVLYGFFLSKKHLNVLEGIMCWMSLSVLRQVLNVMIWINLGLIQVSQSLPLYWGVCFDRLLLFPILELWFVNQYIGANGWKKKTLYFLVFLFLITSFETLTVRLGLVKYMHWTIWRSILYWSFTMVVGIFILIGFRKLLISERRPL